MYISLNIVYGFIEIIRINKMRTNKLIIFKNYLYSLFIWYNQDTNAIFKFIIRFNYYFILIRQSFIGSKIINSIFIEFFIRWYFIFKWYPL